MNKYTLRAIQHISDNNARDMKEYAANMILVPESRRWDYAIPENYTNYQDGFLEQDFQPYRGMPLINYNGTVLYLFRIMEFPDLCENEAEKYLLYDRGGKKYTFVTTKEEHSASGNQSYFDFISRVKKYIPTRKEILKKRLTNLTKLKGEP